MGTVQHTEHHCSCNNSFWVATALLQGIVDEEKKIYEWVFAEVQEFTAPTVLDTTTKGRFPQVPANVLKQCKVDVPHMSLESTAEYFVNRLSAADRDALRSTMQLLNGKCINVGSTCSGTDIIVPVMSCAFKALSRLFNVSWC